MATNGRRRPPRPKIELVTGAASEPEAAAIAAAVEQFLADTAPAPASPVEPRRRWLQAALEEGVSARQVDARGWGLVRGSAPGLPRTADRDRTLPTQPGPTPGE